MKIQLLFISSIMVFVLGCGGGGSDAPIEPLVKHGELQQLSAIYKDDILKKVQKSNLKNLIAETNALSKDSYVAYYKRMNLLRFVSTPDLALTFALKNDETNTTQKKHVKRNAKLIYKNIWSRKDEYTCKDDGTVSKEVELFPRSRFEVDTYKTNDITSYEYDSCDMGEVTYNGKVEYQVGTSNSGVNEIKIDGTFGRIPLGTFDSRFNALSMETETQKVTLNGTIRYNASSQRTPEPNSTLTSLEKKYTTLGDFEITVYDKSTGESVKLIYNGMLEKVSYYSTDAKSETNASVIDLGVLGKFIYRKTSNYTLRVQSEGKMFTLDVNNNLSGTINQNGEMNAPRPIGYDYSNASVMTVSDHTIRNIVLADGTSRSILDMDTDFIPEANTVTGTVQHTLPLSDVDLMQGVTVIGFDTCPPTNALRARLEELGVAYNYINMQGTTQAKNVFDWFNASAVPYVGINGSFFGGAFYDKDDFTLLLNLYGHDMNRSAVTTVQKKVLYRASVKFKEYYENLQLKDNHTAMAVTNDTPYTYRAWWSFNKNDAQTAKESALTGCETARRKAKIHSKCRVYSVDGVILPQSVIRDIP